MAAATSPDVSRRRPFNTRRLVRRAVFYGLVVLVCAGGWAGWAGAWASALTAAPNTNTAS